MNTPDNQVPRSELGKLLRTNPFVQLTEILLLFAIAFAILNTMGPLAGDDPLSVALVVGMANVLMILYIWAGLKLRGESWKDFGLTFKPVSWKQGLKIIMLSLLVALLGAAGFLLGSVIMANITGIPEAANFTGYNYLKDNFPMLLVTLAGVYLSSSFGEEVIYRAFLINRISEIGKKSKSATIIAVILSAVIFGLIHYQWGPMGMVQTGFMGLAMGICYIWLKKRLWILVLAHAYLDTILLVQLYLASN
ncbi:CPBP family intramembrane glutamic endopeptidase [Fulvivirga sedimenti]|uniref:CPBP family intramembrane metalloprotease n=1 Tax=Fulvivirga sedimenti TaxID=2879465 RepID=A0A9X1HVB1_9BACT|nr:CPBP family intramembrane glutamic endopeptidase [Fulvivirga sedimenti]MCA6078928.1 CPBP family intramembrane metalloprotease [Fulvivirga sedimenti]